MNTSNYQLLIKKLDEFIRKFYVNQILRGTILFFGLALALFVAIVLLEYFGKFNSTVRTGLFYGFALLLVGVFLKLIAVPALKIASIGKRLSHEKASSIIGTHFSEVSDKLGNILQLKSQNETLSSDLITASINQKIETLKPVPFSMAINFKENKKYLKYLIVPAVVIFGLAAFEPKIITDSSTRIIAHDQEFIPVAPYDINIENEELKAFKNEDFNLKVRLIGEEIPNKLNVIYDGQRFLMIKDGKNSFNHSFKNIQKNIQFSLFDGEFESNSFKINTLPKPLLMDFSIELDYPKYLGKSNEVVQNTGDLIVPQGTQIKWVFNTESTDNLTYFRNDSIIDLQPSGENEFTLSDRVFNSGSYGLSAANQYLQNEDTIFYSLDVIPDTRPSIELDTKVDSANPKMRYFKGFVKDDYGFSKLVFYSRYIGTNDSVGQQNRQVIPINLSLPQTDFYYSLNTSTFNLKAGDEIEYYFEIWDNDGVNGSKSARTQKIRFKAPTKSDLQKKNKENNDLVKKELKESIELTKEIKKDLELLNERLLNKKELGFQEKKQLKSLLEKQKKVQKSLDKLNKKNDENNKLQEEFTPEDEALLEKQKQLQELFEKVMTEEMKEMMKKMEEMMEKMKKDDLQKSLEKMELDNKELEKELDRNLELFKQLELEKQLADAKEQLDEIKEKQEELEEKSADKKSDEEELKKEQDELNKEFEELSKEMDEIEKKNEELEEPNDLEKTDDLQEQIKKDMKESSDELEKQNKKKAGEKQKSAGDKMEEMSKKMEGMMMEMQSQANAENLEDLRFLLENLIQLSFDQEDVMEQLKGINRNDPNYVQLTQTQKKIKDDSKIIEDSLFALSKRVQSLSSTINKEMTAVNYNMDKALDELGERRTPQASNRQQLSMTSLNNLALLLDAAVQQMQMQMQEQQGMGKCKKPGDGKPKPGGMKSLQEQLNKQMEGLKKAMEQGKKPGKKPGEGKPGGMGGMSKELAQMAAKQAAIRRAVEQLQEQIDESNSGKEGGGNLKRLGDLMEQTETDLVNKQITNETMLRQQEILTRLLQSEKAEREREKDEKREATEFTDEISRNPNTFFEYNKAKEKEIELLITLPPSFNNYYKTKVSEYFNTIER